MGLCITHELSKHSYGVININELYAKHLLTLFSLTWTCLLLIYSSWHWQTVLDKACQINELWPSLQSLSLWFPQEYIAAQKSSVSWSQYCRKPPQWRQQRQVGEADVLPQVADWDQILGLLQKRTLQSKTVYSAAHLSLKLGTHPTLWAPAYLSSKRAHCALLHVLRTNARLHTGLQWMTSFGTMFISKVLSK